MEILRSPQSREYEKKRWIDICGAVYLIGYPIGSLISEGLSNGVYMTIPVM